MNCEQIAYGLYAEWEGGSMKVVIDSIAEMRPFEAAAVTVYLLRFLHEDEHDTFLIAMEQAAESGHWDRVPAH